MNDTCSVCSNHSDVSEHSVLTTQTNVSQLSRKPRIPVRLTRAQRLANEKRRKNIEKRDWETASVKSKMDSERTRPHREKDERKVPTSRKQISQRSRPSVSKPSVSRQTTRNIHYNTKNATSISVPKIQKVQELNDEDISLVSHQVDSLNKEETIEEIRKRLVKLPDVKDLIHSMIYDLISICFSTHYSKVGGYFIKQTIKNSNTPTDISRNEIEKNNWIKIKQNEYPLVLTDLIARGCFQADLPSIYPSVEEFRNLYINPNTAKCKLLEGYTLWELFGTFAFTFSAIKNLHWNKIHIQYDDENAKGALNLCLDCNLDWGFSLWKAGKDGLNFTRKTS
jgi:hypothetical protein